MPLTVYLLGLSIFALGTSEFMVTGLLPPIATDLAISIPAAALLISAFALGMIVAGPLLAAATLRFPRKPTLLAFLAVFAISHVLGALAPGYAVLFATRVTAAIATAGFWAVGTAVAIAVVPADRRGRAMSVVAGGLSVSTVLGVPTGTFLGEQLGWRGAFWAVAALSTVVVLAVWRFVPKITPTGDTPRLRPELGAYTSPRLWLALGITALTMLAVMATFTYVAPLLTEVLGVPVRWIPVMLGLYGLGALVGVSLGGRSADHWPLTTLFCGNLAVGVIMLALGAFPSVPMAVVGMLALGFAGFVTTPALNTQVFTHAEAAPTLAGSTNVTAFNIGIVLAPVLSGLFIDAGFGFGVVTWVSLAVVGLALIALTIAATWDARVPLLPAVSLAATQDVQDQTVNNQI